VNLLGDNINTIKRKTELLIEATTERKLIIVRQANFLKLTYRTATSSPKCRLKSIYNNNEDICKKCGTFQIFGNNSNKSTFD
jgi:hypothetical protein